MSQGDTSANTATSAQLLNLVLSNATVETFETMDQNLILGLCGLVYVVYTWAS